ncbi:MAG: CGNR zinc finger domain-containing protein [Cytophagales bacterium]|nr:CGNR zinc finger domain-containing protein [Cytophagales bacterium]
MQPDKSIRTIAFDGGCACFDFVNTVDQRLTTPVREYLRSYDDVLVLSERLALLPGETLAALAAYAAGHAEEAEGVRAEIVRVRENMYALFAAVAAGKPVAPAVLAGFNHDLGMVFSHLRFGNAAGPLQLALEMAPDDLYLPLRVALRSACDLLTNHPPSRIKSCPACSWLFLDASKNNTRRWCDMQVCGSNDKAKRYYHRKRNKMIE